MALVLKDRVKETSVSTGTGAITLAGTTGAYQPFSVIGDGNTTYYAIAGQTTNEWEVGIGTYTLSTDSISRDTILSSSNSNTIVTFSAGTKDVFVTYPSEKGLWVDASGTSNYAATIGSTAVNLGATVSNLAGLTSVTVTQDPSVALDLATKQYVDGLVSSGITYHAAVKYEVPDSTGNLTATYNNGTAGVGATLTNAGTQVAFTPDGIVATAGDRVLVYNQTNAAQNGVYEVTTVGSGATNWVLTRTTDTDSYGLKDPNALGNGDAFFISSGNTGAGETYVCNTTGVITFGTTAITFQQISASQVYIAGTGLTLSPATTFNIANTAVTPASYGAASKTLTATVNAQGQLTSLADNNIAIAMSQVTSGTLGATQGGTDQSSYSIGDILYADTTTSLARLADVATGNALISGGLNVAPSWGKIALASAVSGTLGVANGGTGVTTSTGSGNVVLSTSPTLVTPVLGTPTSGNFSTGTFTWPTFNQNTTGTASNVTGTVAVLNGGTGNTTAQGAINTLAGATTSGQYLRGNGTNVVMSTIQAGDVPTLNQNTTGTASNVTGTVAVLNGGTGSTTAAGARTNLGATTVGSNFFTLTNPTAITFPRMNADNTVSALDAATFRTAIGAGTSSTTGTVTSVSGTAPIAVATGTTTPAISIAQATTSTSGYLSSTDWNTFNGKQAAGSYVTVGGALGTPSSGTLTNCTFPTLNQNTTGSSGSCTGNSATATNATTAANLSTAAPIYRTAAGAGYLNGQYPSYESTGTSGAIYSIGGSYVPGTTTLGNMYGIGYGYSGNAGITATGAPISNWGMYVASGGVSRIFLSSDSGTGYFNGAIYSGGTQCVTNTGSWGISVTGSSASCTGNAATATTATNLSGGTVAATTITATGNITAYFSDERLKTRLGTIENALAKVQTLDGFYYEPNEVAQALGYEVKREVGVSAQQVQAILPEIIAPAPIDAQYLTVDYERLVPLLIEAIKELKAEVDELKKAK